MLKTVQMFVWDRNAVLRLWIKLLTLRLFFPKEEDLAGFRGAGRHGQTLAKCSLARLQFRPLNLFSSQLALEFMNKQLCTVLSL